MKRSIPIRNLVATLLMGFYMVSQAQVVDNIDWPHFMGQHDLIWEETPLQWNEGGFVGNGQVGMMIHATMDDNRFDFHVGRQDVTDHKKAPDRKTSMGVEGAGLYDFSRLDIGRMVLRPAGKIQSVSMHQDLWNAEVRGTIFTDIGEISFKAYTPYDRMLNVVEINSTETLNGQKVDYTWEWIPGNPISPRVMTRLTPKLRESYKVNPRPVIKEIRNISVCEQSLLAGGDYATAWKEQKLDSKAVMYIATANEVPASGVSAQVAVEIVQKASSVSTESLLKTHRDWWHEYFKQSFLTMPDKRMESFYWIQLYKMATCSRADGPALDLMGPFFKNTSWPGLWWNLNVQLTYWPFNTSNHLDIAENFIKLIDDHFAYMVEHRSGKNLGDFAWATHNYWLYFKFKGDDTAIHQKWVPKALEILEKYKTKMIHKTNGQIELTPMGSPEYEGFKAFPNANYNLAILRWLLNALIESHEKFGERSEAIKEWKQILHNLIDYPVDENGLMIGSNQSVDMSHRHYSHLLALYPLFQLNPDSPEDRELVDKSVVHWHKIEDGSKLVGYSYTGAASLYAALGRGDDANGLLQDFLDGNIGTALLLANTFYMEGKGRNPVIETPLSAASSITELQLQSWGDKIRVFPAVPSAWKSASFKDLRAQGGFLVSANRSEGKTQWVSIKSLAGRPCILKVPDWNKAVQIDDGKKIKITKTKEGEFQIDLKQGDTIVVSANGNLQESKISPVTHGAEAPNFYGVKKGKSLEKIMEYDVPLYGLD